MGKISIEQLSDNLIDFITSSGSGTGSIQDGSVTEAKLHQDVKNKLNEITTLKETVRYKDVSITEADLDQGLKNKLNGPKTWANLMGN